MTQRTAQHRVLRLITRLNIGGPARHALLLSRELGAEFPTLLAAGDPGPGEGELTDPEVDVIRLPLTRPLDPRKDLAAGRAVRRLLAQHDIRLVDSHMAKAGTVGRLAAASVRGRIRTVHTFHGHVLDGYFRPAVQHAFIAAERALAARTDVLVAISDEIRDSLLRLRIGRPEQYRLIPLGFDLRAHLAVDGRTGSLRRAIGLDPHTPLVGALGRLAPIKNHALLLEAMKLLPDVHLAILGEGELSRALRAAARDQGLEARAHFVGWRTDVPAVMGDLDVVVISSRNEGTPVSLIEALACGVPVVATDVGGVRSVVKEDVSGYLVPSGDGAALAERVRTLMSSESLRHRLGAAGRADVRDRYSKERLVSDIRSLYDELLS
jgi:glycosyltransferase involved in cell wall biosynthesis